MKLLLTALLTLALLVSVSTTSSAQAPDDPTGACQPYGSACGSAADCCSRRCSGPCPHMAIDTCCK